jgi:hypothetical protein
MSQSLTTSYMGGGFGQIQGSFAPLRMTGLWMLDQDDEVPDWMAWRAVTHLLAKARLQYCLWRD